ncbi:MAG: hypothetical protein ACREMA_15885 [Longimicrobiales bacterium]
MLLLAPAATARMYQWVDPETQTTQLSGTPPTWYRSEGRGPRVVVFDKGQVIDDTGIRISDPERDQLRQEAFIRAEQDRQAAEQKLLQAKQLKAVFDRQQRGEDDEAAEELPLPELPEELGPEASTEAPEDTGPTPEQLRALIEQWEQSRARNARQLVESSPTPPPDAAGAIEFAPPPN